MRTLRPTEARAGLHRPLAEVSESHEPMHISGKHQSAELISGDDYRALAETADLLSMPGMRESIREGLATPLEDCSDDPGW